MRRGCRAGGPGLRLQLCLQLRRSAGWLPASRLVLGVVLLFDVLHTFDRVLFCAGEDGAEFAELCAGLEASPFEIFQIGFA